jgi:hypothetical protein
LQLTNSAATKNSDNNFFIYNNFKLEN